MIFAVILFLAMAFLIVLNDGGFVSLRCRPGKTVEAKKPEIDTTLSAPSRAILGQFDVTPVENQPFSRYDLEESLRALDFKNTIEKVHEHFNAGHTLRHINFMYCNCHGPVRVMSKHVNTAKGRVCKMPEYQDIYDSLIAIKYAIKAQEEALAKARYREELDGKKPDLDRVASLTARLRSEADILNEVAREL